MFYPWTEEELLRRARAFPKLIEQQLKALSGSFDFLVLSMGKGWGKLDLNQRPAGYESAALTN